MKIRQHISNFCSGIEPREIEFNSLAELMAISWVKYWTDDENFFRFSISNEHHLMAETHAGEKWWVVGYLTNYQLDLPKWIAKVTKAPIPRPTEIKDDRMRCGQVKRHTVDDINRDMKFQAERDRKNLCSVIE